MPRLSAQAIIAYQNINSFNYANQWSMNAGDTVTLYFQVIDLDQGVGNTLSNQPFRYGYPLQSPIGQPALRYLLGIGTQNQPYSIVVTFPSIDNSKVIQLNAFQASPNDSSIWGVNIPSVYTPQSGAVFFTVKEGNFIRNFSVINLITVEYPTNNGCDGILPSTNTNNYDY